MKKNNPKTNNIFINKVIKYFTFLLVIILIYFINNLTKNLGRDYEYIDSYYEIEEPIKEEINDEETIKINDIELKISKLYTYELKGYVTSTFTYLPYNIGNKLSPKDITVIWDDLVKKENRSKIKFYQTGDRIVMTRVDDLEWLESFGDYNHKMSNNHLIPANKKVKKQIRKIKKGDYIKIKGYLVDIESITDDYEFYWNTSTSLYDTGKSCEIIYVEEVTWLKEK